MDILIIVYAAGGALTGIVMSIRLGPCYVNVIKQISINSWPRQRIGAGPNGHSGRQTVRSSSSFVCLFVCVEQLSTCTDSDTAVFHLLPL